VPAPAGQVRIRRVEIEALSIIEAMASPPISAPAVAGTGGVAADDPRWQALCSRDARFDGRVFVGVTSTGIYCRPVCPARTPLRRHVRFFDHAAAADLAGFRPCLRCRPELAPGLSRIDTAATLAREAAALITRAVHDGEPLAMPVLAARLGVTDRHLRRLFQAELGVSPGDYAATQRLLLAKQMLTDTRLPVTEVALASGFTSLRRFHAAFAERWRLTPSSLRRAMNGAHGTTEGADRSSTVTVSLPLRLPFDGDGLLHFLQRRALPGVEQVDLRQRTWRRTLTPRSGGDGWFEARLDTERPQVRLTLSASLVPDLGRVRRAVRDALDLDADPAVIDRALAGLPGGVHAGVRVPGAVDGFDAAVRVVLGQQVSVAAARTLAVRLATTLGRPAVTPHDGLDRHFPTPAALAAADPDLLGRLGIVRQRVRALQALARAVDTGTIALHPGAPLEATLQALRTLPGFGEWTVQLIALRALAWPDAYPATDLGVLTALAPHTGDRRDATAAAGLTEPMRPWRAYAVMQLWRRLDPPPSAAPPIATARPAGSRAPSLPAAPAETAGDITQAAP
jgi:AraC family transcriptional regulator of adaptative response / DNA-3-methyladenine glycosylase II